MAIVNSEITEDAAQIDGRRHITERHTDQIGIARFVRYIAQAGENVSAAMAARVAQIDAQLVEIDCQRVLGIDAPPSLIYASAAQLGAFVREKYRNGKSEELARIAQWITNRITEGTFTETQVRNFFGLTLNQWNTLKAKMQALKAAYEEVLAAEGE